jgi:hypothetical protein
MRQTQHLWHSSQDKKHTYEEIGNPIDIQESLIFVAYQFMHRIGM